MTANPFQPAEAKEKKPKILLWGDSGTGKTWLSLQFPVPVVMDLDFGSDLYGEKFQFHRKQTTSIADIKNAVVWLASENHQYKTLVIDPITLYWEQLQKFWSDIFLKRNRGKANKHEFYDLGPKEWMTIRRDFKELFNRVMALDLNIVCTAREAVNYKQQAGDYMVADGVRYDAEKGTKYHFDTVIRLFKEEGKYMAESLKDRSERLPIEPFEINYSVLAKCFGLQKQNQDKTQKMKREIYGKS